jgi:predicted Mrr-cat superfamily restriction endonuclease
MLWKIYCRWNQDYARGCFTEGVIALGWGDHVTNVEELRTRSAVARALKMEDPKNFGSEDARSRLNVVAGVVWRYVHEMGIGDLVVLPDSVHDVHYVGTVTSGSFVDLNAPAHCPFKLQRRMDWHDVPMQPHTRRLIWGPGRFGGIQSLSTIAKGEPAVRAFMRGEEPFEGNLI